MPFGIGVPDLETVTALPKTAFRRSVKAIKRPASRAMGSIEDTGHGLKQQVKKADRSIFGGGGIKKNVGDIRKLLKDVDTKVKAGK